MADMGSSIVSPVLVKVEAAGTAVQLAPTGVTYTARSVLIQALSTNTSPVVIGDKNVKAKAGVQATPEQRGIELSASQSIALDIADASSLFVDSRTSKDGVTVLIVTA